MKRDNNFQIVVGLSGGVDSSVSLLLLKKQGYQPIGVSLKYAVWENKRNILRENVCCSEASFSIAREICKRLDVPYYIIDEQIDFKEKVIGYFLNVLKDKKTPNPCLACNRLVKFNKLFEFAKKKGAKYVATGHYARVRKNKKTGKYELLRGKDDKKDQSYFLCLLDQEQLAKIIFPLGDYTKEQVYRIAQKEGFEFFTKVKQSQDLCFVAQQSILPYLEEEIGLEPGEIVDKKGSVLGQHQGLHFYTIGQRKGIGLAGGPWWVVGFNRKKNQLIVTNKENDPALFSKEVIVADYHFISGQAPIRAIKAKAKTRFNQKLASVKIHPPKDNKLKLVFDKPQKAVALGQWAVFYDGDVCLGGGVIEKSYPIK
jgi:tRNA-specific 2-thiouridylase